MTEATTTAEVRVQAGDRIARRYVAQRPDDVQLDGATSFIGRDERLHRFVTIHRVTSVAPTSVIKAANRARLVGDQRFARVLAASTEGTGANRRSYVVTERPQGIGLDEMLGMAALAPDVAAAVVGAAADALSRAARDGVFHGVVTARNLVVTAKGRVIITGLGFEGELARQSGRLSRHRDRDDAIALARLYVEGVTGRSFGEVVPDDLPEDLSPAAHDFAVSVIKGKGPRALDAVVESLGTGSYPALRLLADEAPRLWWPAAPSLPAPLPSGDDDAITTEIDVVPVADVPVAHVPVDDLPTDEIAAADVATDLEVAPVEAEIVDEDAIIEVEPPQRPLTRFGRAVDDLDEFHDIVAAQNAVVRPSVMEAILNRLENRFPGSDALARAALAARERAQAPAPFRPGPLLVSLFIVTVFVASMVAIDRIQTPIDPIGDGDPGESYPEFSFAPQPPGSE